MVGRAEGNRLRADDSGSLVSWVELAEDGHPQYVVLDTARQEEVARVDDQTAGASIEWGDWGAQVFAVDDGSVYWRHGRTWSATTCGPAASRSCTPARRWPTP